MLLNHNKEKAKEKYYPSNMKNKRSLANTVALWPRRGNYVGFLDG